MLAPSLLLMLALEPAVRERTVAVLPIDLTGSAPVDRLQQRLAEGMSHPGMAVSSGSTVAQVLGDDVGCRAPRCREAVDQRLGAAYLLRTTVSHTDSVWQVSLELVATADGRTVARVSDACEICGLDEAAELLRDRAATIVGRLERLDQRAPELSIVTDPPGAKVWVDGRQVGLSPVHEQVEPGLHVVEVALGGHVRQRREIEATAGIDVPIRIALSVAPRRPAHPRVRPVAGAAVGLGALLIGTGAGLLVLDGREYRRECDPDARGTCAQLYETTAASASLLAAGIAVAITGTVLLATKGRRSRRDVAMPWGPKWRF